MEKGRGGRWDGEGARGRKGLRAGFGFSQNHIPTPPPPSSLPQNLTRASNISTIPQSAKSRHETQIVNTI